VSSSGPIILFVPQRTTAHSLYKLRAAIPCAPWLIPIGGRNRTSKARPVHVSTPTPPQKGLSEGGGTFERGASTFESCRAKRARVAAPYWSVEASNVCFFVRHSGVKHGSPGSL
jgi:hypothetical protein